MSLLNSPHSYDSSLIEATVTNVDPIRFVCSVKTTSNQYLNDVPWLLPTGGSGNSGMHFAPNRGDQVIINTSLSYPIILGCLPKMGVPDNSLTNVSGQEFTEDTGNPTSMKGDYVANPNKPSDFVPGDKVITSEGGGLIALLENGTVFLRSSWLAHVVISKFNDLVRVVARNWERFSDVGQHTAANARGRLYEFFGWDRKLSRSKLGLYELTDVIGDVVAGETLGGNPNLNITPAAADTRIRKYALTSSAGSTLMLETLEDSGNLTLKVITPGTPGSFTEEFQSKDTFRTKATDGSNTTTITLTPGSIVVDSNNNANVTVTPSSVVTNVAGTSTVTVTGGSIVSTHASGTVTMDSSKIKADYSGAVLNLDSTGAQLTYSGHFISVGPSGISVG